MLIASDQQCSLVRHRASHSTRAWHRLGAPTEVAASVHARCHGGEGAGGSVSGSARDGSGLPDSGDHSRCSPGGVAVGCNGRPAVGCYVALRPARCGYRLLHGLRLGVWYHYGTVPGACGARRAMDATVRTPEGTANGGQAVAILQCRRSGLANRRRTRAPSIQFAHPARLDDSLLIVRCRLVPTSKQGTLRGRATGE